MIADILEAMPLKYQGNSLCQLGCIKIGGLEKKERRANNGTVWYAPEKYDHFRLTTMNRDATKHLIEDKALMEQLAGNPKFADADGKIRRIPIRVLSDDIDDIMQSAFVWYGSRTVGARSDGHKVTWFNDPQSGKKYPEPVEANWTPDMLDWKNSKGAPLFKIHTIFSCVIAANEARWGGVFKFRTTSVISMKQLHSSLLHLSQLTGGVLMGMPLILAVRPMQVAPDGRAATVHVVHVELHGSDMIELQKNALAMAQFRLSSASQIQQTSRQYRKLLSAPGTETGDEAADISDEFVPPEEKSDIQGVPAETRVGLLDDEPANAEPGQAAEQPAQDESQTIIEPEVGQDDIREIDESELVMQEETKEPEPQMPSFVGVKTWADFVKTMNEIAMDREGVTPSIVTAALKKIQVRKGWIGPKEKTAEPKFMQDVCAGAFAGHIDWTTGFIKRPEPEPAPA